MRRVHEKHSRRDGLSIGQGFAEHVDVQRLREARPKKDLLGAGNANFRRVMKFEGAAVVVDEEIPGAKGIRLRPRDVEKPEYDGFRASSIQGYAAG